MKAALLFCTGAILSTYTAAKEQLYVTENPNDMALYRPSVDSPNCKVCALDDEFNKICVNYGANLKVGWQFDQDWYDDPLTVTVLPKTGYFASTNITHFDFDGWYQTGLQIYSDQGAGLATLIDIDNLWYNKVDFEVEQFKANLGIEVKYYYSSRRTCIGAYNSLDDFQIFMNMEMKFMECYKDILDALWCYENWTGRDAKIFGRCEFSSPQLIQMYEYDVKRTVANPNYWLNSADVSTNDCIPGLLWTSTNPDSLPNVMQNRFWAWFQDLMSVYDKTMKFD